MALVVIQAIFARFVTKLRCFWGCLGALRPIRSILAILLLFDLVSNLATSSFSVLALVRFESL